MDSHMMLQCLAVDAWWVALYYRHGIKAHINKIMCAGHESISFQGIIKTLYIYIHTCICAGYGSISF